MDETEYVAANQFRLELILLGCALAKEGDREKILKEMLQGDFFGKRTTLAIEGIRHQDVEVVTGVFATLGVNVPAGSTVVDALIARIKEMGRERIAKQVMDNRTGTVEERLEAALDLVRAQ